MNGWPDTNLSLIRRAANPRDETAWRELEAIYRPVILHMARRAGLSPEAAEDLAQQVFLNVFKAIDRWQPQPGGPAFRNWLGRVTRNAILNALSRRPHDPGVGGSSLLQQLQQLPADHNPHAHLDTELRRAGIRAAAAAIQPEFSPQTWNLFWQTTIDGLSVQQAANASNCSPGAVYSARSRVLARLKRQLQHLSDLWETDP